MSIKSIYIGTLTAVVVIIGTYTSPLFYKLIPITYHLELRQLNFSYERENINHILKTIDKADFNDTVYIHIMSPGGTVTQGLAIANALLSTPAHTVTDVRSAAFSAAAFITMAGKEIRIGAFSEIMFHRARFGDTLANIEEPIVRELERFIRIYVKPYLTKEEIIRYDNGEDVFITGHDFKRRLE